LIRAFRLGVCITCSFVELVYVELRRSHAVTNGFLALGHVLTDLDFFHDASLLPATGTSARSESSISPGWKFCMSALPTTRLTGRRLTQLLKPPGLICTTEQNRLQRFSYVFRQLLV
jgi:hypothetical protein